MIKTLFAVLCLLLAVPGPAAAQTRTDDAGLARLIEQGALVVDIRTPPEWVETGTVPGARRLTAYDAQGQLDPAFFDRLAALGDPAAPVALICRTGRRTDRLAPLVAARFPGRAVYSVGGGTLGWIAAGRPVAPAAP